MTERFILRRLFVRAALSLEAAATLAVGAS